jgi:hypothetical protein
MRGRSPPFFLNPKASRLILSREAEKAKARPGESRAGFRLKINPAATMIVFARDLRLMGCESAVRFGLFILKLGGRDGE